MPDFGERANNFDAVRLIAALTVLVGHAWSLAGVSGGPEIAGVRAFDVAVWVFFSLSGFLVATSWTRSPRVIPFLARRAARIFPALAVAVLVTVVLIGPLMTTRSVSEYVGSPTTWRYLCNILLLASYDLPGVFEQLDRPVVNGFLWTIGPEFCCYLVVVLVGVVSRPYGSRVGARLRIGALIVLAVLLAAVSSVVGNALGGFEPVARAATFFMLGAVLAHLGRACHWHPRWSARRCGWLWVPRSRA